MPPAFMILYVNSDLFQFELVANGQHATIAIPLDGVTLLVQLGQRSCTTEVEGDTILELIRETNGKSEVEAVAIILTINITSFCIN